MSVFMMMTGCTETEAQVDDPSYRIITFSANIGASESSTRAELSQDYNSLDFNTLWEDGDELQVFLEQSKKIYRVGMVGISNISDDAKKASFSIQLPKEIDVNKPVKMYAFCGIEGEMEQNTNGSWFASCQVDLLRSALVHFRAPLYCETTLEDVKNPDLVLFWHFVTYEVLHVENTSNDAISFSLCGYNVEVPWYQGSTYLRLDQDFNTTVLDADWKGEAQSETVNIPAGRAVDFISMYMPSGYMMHNAIIKALINKNLIVSSNKKSSSVSLEPGHAYHLYANWDGRILTFNDGEEEAEKIIGVSPATIKLGPVVVGESKSGDFVVSNEGEGDLTFQVESTHNLFDIPESGKDFTLGKGAEKKFTVTFTPTEADKEYSYVVAITSDAINGTKYVKITANTVEPERIDRVIPRDIRNTMEPYINIYDGDNPPKVEGVYLMSPLQLVYDSGGYENDDWADVYLHLYNQDVVNNTIDYEEQSETKTQESTGKGAFISGEGDKFSIFFNTNGVVHLDGHDVSYKEALVISGIKTDEGIKDLEYAFTLVEKIGDTTDRLMDVGGFRVFKDGDGISSNSTWPGNTRAFIKCGKFLDLLMKSSSVSP